MKSLVKNYVEPLLPTSEASSSSPKSRSVILSEKEVKVVFIYHIVPSIIKTNEILLTE